MSSERKIKGQVRIPISVPFSFVDQLSQEDCISASFVFFDKVFAIQNLVFAPVAHFKVVGTTR